MTLSKPDRIEAVYPQHCTDCPHRTHCGKLKVHDTCYTVDIIVKKETVKYEIMECDCGGVQEVAKRPAGISGTVTYGNRLKALVCVLSTKGMVAMKNLCEIIRIRQIMKCSFNSTNSIGTRQIIPRPGNSRQLHRAD